MFIKKQLNSILVILMIILSFILLTGNNYPSNSVNLIDFIDGAIGKISHNFPAKETNEISTKNIALSNLSAHTLLKFEESIERNRIKLEEINYENAFNDKVLRTENILARYNSVMQGYGEIIVRQSEACGGDYRVLLAIAGNESGFGRIPYKYYNPYGYLDGVQYGSWAEALEILSCKISSQHLAPCNNDVHCIAYRYGGPETDKEQWISNINWFISQI